MEDAATGGFLRELKWQCATRDVRRVKAGC